MIVDKDQIIQLLLGQGKSEEANEAASELPDQVDTKNPDHAGLLSKHGIDVGSLGGMPSALDAAPSIFTGERHNRKSPTPE
jgi:hypothetical protein